MLEYLKGRMMPLEKPEQASSEMVQRWAVYRQRQAAVRELVTQYEAEARSFDDALDALARCVERLTRLSLLIGEEVAWLSQESQALQDATTVLSYTPVDISVSVGRRLGAARVRGLQPT